MTAKRGVVILVFAGLLLVAVGLIVGSPNAAGGEAVCALRGYGAKSNCGSVSLERVGIPALYDGNLWLGAGFMGLLTGGVLAVIDRSRGRADRG